MAGHSKFKNIMYRKGAQDARRAKLFTKLIREITVAARAGLADPDTNSQLRLAVQAAKAANMAKDTIERAITRGSGPGEGERYEEIRYEGFAPGGVAVIVEALTDNRNRTAAEVRAAFSRGGGNLGDAGSVAWIFESRAVVTVESLTEAQAEELALAAIDAGAEDFSVEGGSLEITGPPTALEPIPEVLKEAGVEPAQATVTMAPTNTVALDTGAAGQTLRLLDVMEELDDVQQVFTNADFTEEALASYSAE